MSSRPDGDPAPVASAPAGPTVDTALHTVLSGPKDGILPQLVREQLVGVLTRLAVTLHDGSADGDATEVVNAGGQLFDALSAHLRSRGAQMPPPAEPTPAAEPESPELVEVSPRDRLHELVEELTADGVVKAHLGTPPTGGSGAELWEWLHLRSLGLPHTVAQDTRRRAADLLDVPVGKQIIPACPALDHPGWGEDPEVERELRGVLSQEAFERYHQMIKLVVQVLSVLTRPVDLSTGHSGYSRESVQQLNPDQRAAYREFALGYVRKLEFPDQGDVTWLVKCDELVRSVFPEPLPAPDSWWGKLSDRSAAVLRKFAGEYGATVQFPEPGRSVDDEQVAALLDQDHGQVLLRGPADDARRVLWLLRAGHQGNGARVLVGEE
ncbi:MAG: hypothetical protein ACRDRP_02695 [Pseudonocardiaceae bacterium]